MFHHSRHKDSHQEICRTPSSRALHLNLYLTLHRPSLSHAPKASSSLSHCDVISAERTSVYDDDIDQTEDFFPDLHDVPIAADHTPHHPHHPHPRPHSALPEIFRRTTLAHPFRWTRRKNSTPSNSSSTSSSADIGERVGHSGLKIKLKIKKVKGHGMQVLHGIFRGSKEKTKARVNSEEQNDNVCRFCVVSRSTMTEEERGHVPFDHLEASCLDTTADTFTFSDLGADSSNESGESSIFTTSCCPLPVDELVPDSPILCSTSALEIDPPEFWSLEGEPIEEVEDKELSAAVVEGGSQRDARMTDTICKVQGQSLVSPIQLVCTTFVPENLLYLAKQDTLDWNGHLRLQHILSTVFDMLSPPCCVFEFKSELESAVHPKIPIKPIPAERDASNSADLLPLPIQSDNQLEEEKEREDLSLDDMSPSTESLKGVVPLKKTTEDVLPEILDRIRSSVVDHSSKSQRNLEHLSRKLVISSVEISSQSSSEEENEHDSEILPEKIRDSIKIVARRRMSLPVLLYRHFIPVQLSTHQGSCQFQVYRPILGLAFKSIGGITGKRKTFFVGNVGLWSSGGL